MEEPEMIIELKDEAEPYFVNEARQISFVVQPAAKRQSENYVAEEIMIPVTSNWAALLVVTRKKDASLRLCVNHAKLNRHNAELAAKLTFKKYEGV